MHEAEVRERLSGRLEAERVNDPDTRIVHELGLCQAEARIDVAVINGHLTGWEIKTAADTLARLPRQVEVYSRIFDRVWLATEDRHMAAARDLVPEWWGILRVEEAGDDCRMTVLRRPRLNRSVDLRSLVRLLWRDEAYDELCRVGRASGLARAPRRVLWEELASAAPRSISKTALKARVRWRLKSREGWRSG